jgi:hypothetical protein
MIAASPAEFRKEAEGYTRQAQALPFGMRHLRFLDMARSCIRLADEAEWLTDFTQDEASTITSIAPAVAEH